MDFHVVRGEIAEQSADALVSVANTDLGMEGGVAEEFRDEGGEILNEAAVSKGPINLGTAVVTDAYGLDADYVIHASTMAPGRSATEGSIRDATRNALRAADQNGCESVVLPAFGSDVAGVATGQCVPNMAREIACFESRNLSEVRLITYDDDEYETVRRSADDVR